jgi:hypothetical protein
MRKNILEGYENMDSDGVSMRVYDDISDGGIPYENTIFVSSIHDYYPPFSRVVQNEDKIYMPIHNSKRNYEEQINKFR